MNRRKIFHYECGPTLAKVPRVAVGSPFLEMLRTQQDSKELDPIASALRGVGPEIFMSVFPPKLFYDLILKHPV